MSGHCGDESTDCRLIRPGQHAAVVAFKHMDLGAAAQNPADLAQRLLAGAQMFKHKTQERPVELSVSKRQSVDIGDLELNVTEGVGGEALLRDPYRVRGAIDRDEPRLRIAARQLYGLRADSAAGLKDETRRRKTRLRMNEFGQDVRLAGQADLLRCRIAMHVGVGHANSRDQSAGTT